MERYEAYKDSGVEWLGEIPVGWEVKRFRYVFDLITDKTGDNLLKIGLENIESGSGKFVATDNEFEGDGIHFLSGDILFGKLRPYLAKVYLADFRGKAVGDFFVFRSKGEIKEQFGAKLILSKRFIDITNSSTYGSKMPRVSWDFISELLIAYPNFEEQTAIANFLNRKTAEIDALIAQKERLLELYEEEKTAIINHAVTKGIDPNVEFKDSGVKWLGEIPAEWEVKKLKYEILVNPLKDNHDGSSDELVTFLPMDSVSENGEVDCSIKKPVFGVSNGFTFFRKNDVIVAKITPCFENGKCVLLSDLDTSIGFGSTEFHVLRSKGRIIDKFLYYITKSEIFMQAGEAFMYGAAGQKRVPSVFISDFPLVFANRFEQTAIVQHIEAETGRVDTKIAKTQRIIELQREYRTALISEAVTGKIKVPELPTQEASA